MPSKPDNHPNRPTVHVHPLGASQLVETLVDPEAKLERDVGKPTVPRKNGSRIGSEEREGKLMYYLDCASCGIKSHNITMFRRCPSCGNVP